MPSFDPGLAVPGFPAGRELSKLRSSASRLRRRPAFLLRQVGEAFRYGCPEEE